MTGFLTALSPVLVPLVTAFLGWLQGRSSHRKLERDLEFRKKLEELPNNEFRKKLEELPNNEATLAEWDRMIQRRVQTMARAGATWIGARTRVLIKIALLVLFVYLIAEAWISYLTLITEQSRFYDATLDLQIKQLAVGSLWVRRALCWAIAPVTAISAFWDMYLWIRNRKADRSTATPKGAA